MYEARGSLGDHNALELLRDLHLARATGVLNLETGPRRDTCYFVVGDLYLPPGHRASRQLRAAAGAEELADRSGVVGSVVESLAEWTDGTYSFADGVAAISSDLTGPFPTPAIVMAAAVYGQTEAQLLRALGGEERRFAAAADAAVDPERLKLHPHEAFLLSRLESPIAVRELLRQADLERREGLERIRRLHAIDLIRPVEQIPQDDPTRLLSPEIVERFSARVREDLERRPLSLSAEEHREEVTRMLRGLGERTFYELLDIDAGAAPDEIYSAYMRVARRVHPDHRESLSLQRREGLDLLFERSTEAYLTLSDQDRNREYSGTVGSQGGLRARGQSSEERAREQRALAQRNFLKARELVLHEEYHYAMELLHQAVRVDPRAEYYELLAECAERNPHWLGKAILYYRLALEQSPEDVDLRLRLAERLAESGDHEGAQAEYREILEIQPGHAVAKERLRSTPKSTEGPGLLGRVFGALRR